MHRVRSVRQFTDAYARSRPSARSGGQTSPIGAYHENVIRALGVIIRPQPDLVSYYVTYPISKRPVRSSSDIQSWRLFCVLPDSYGGLCVHITVLEDTVVYGKEKGISPDKAADSRRRTPSKSHLSLQKTCCICP